MKYNGKDIMSVFMKGESAFDIYKKYHPEYTGTEEEWLKSITPSIEDIVDAVCERIDIGNEEEY